MSDDDWSDKETGDDDESGGNAQRNAFAARMKANLASNDSLKPVPCEGCKEEVPYALQIKIDGVVFHKSCLRCKVCSKVLSPGNYTALEKSYYCKPHFKQLFQTKGNYSESFGEANPKDKWIDKGGAEESPSASS